MRSFLGIDPGVSGGMVLLTENLLLRKEAKGGSKSDPRRAVSVSHVFTFHNKTERDIWGEFVCLNEDYIVEKAFIEQVNAGAFGFGKAGHKMGAKSAFTFGRNFGTLLAILCASDIPHEEVRPADWQATLKCRTKGDKNVSKRKAQQLFPDFKWTHATADAALIAECCRRSFE